MKKVFLTICLFATIVLVAAPRIVRFTGTCGVVTTLTFAEGTTNEQVATAYRTWNYYTCDKWVKNVAITTIYSAE